MAEQLTKLRPDRDLQCYFERPSAIAAFSETSAAGFTLSGCWRQQFDWAVVEWNRDNVFEHPALRNLPDGDLSGLRLSYEETRTNCIPLDSTLPPTVDWPFLRIWAECDGVERVYWVRLRDYATPVAGDYVNATAEFELAGTPTAGDYIELAWLDKHFNYQLNSGDTLETAAAALAGIINSWQETGRATAAAIGNRITLTYLDGPGGNANRVGAYGTVHGAGTESWLPLAEVFQGGASPHRWKVELDFANLRDKNGELAPTSSVRKMRWTWAADLQRRSYERSEFSVTVSNWSVSGTGLEYQLAGVGGLRIEDDSAEIAYEPESCWTESRGNFSGGSIRWTSTPGASLICEYAIPADHALYLGTRRAAKCAAIAIQVDDDPPVTQQLALAEEDVLVRLPLGARTGGTPHRLTITHNGAAGDVFYFDFIEAAVASVTLPEFQPAFKTALAIDWDTDHSLALAPERTAWLVHALGFHGRVNSYTGALWFYELNKPGHRYASGTITFSGTPQWSEITEVRLDASSIQHVNLIGDTAESVAKCVELLINAGSTGVWAQAEGSVLTITAREMGDAGNRIAFWAGTGGGGFAVQTSGPTLSGGTSGVWRTDLTAMPRLNRAARDWNRSFFRALKGYGMESTAAFSMELQHGDDAPAVGIAQRYPDGAVWLSTPALQTNFGPVSTAFWRQTYRDMADVMAEAGVSPYLQFGEVQWWYFASKAGMPFYDDHATSEFLRRYGRPMAVIPSERSDPGPYSQECAFLQSLIGEFTAAIMAYVRQTQPGVRFEVLYPPDVNDTALNRTVNYPTEYWTPNELACLKTENFTYTGDRNLDNARESIDLPARLNFRPEQRSHLVGIGEYTTPWERERRLALEAGVQSVVLFALDQFCLIGYAAPLRRGARRAVRLGS